MQNLNRYRIGRVFTRLRNKPRSGGAHNIQGCHIVLTFVNTLLWNQEGISQNWTLTGLSLFKHQLPTHLLLCAYVVFECRPYRSYQHHWHDIHYYF